MLRKMSYKDFNWSAGRANDDRRLNLFDINSNNFMNLLSSANVSSAQIA